MRAGTLPKRSRAHGSGPRLWRWLSRGRWQSGRDHESSETRMQNTYFRACVAFRAPTRLVGGVDHGAESADRVPTRNLGRKSCAFRVWRVRAMRRTASDEGRLRSVSPGEGRRGKGAQNAIRLRCAPPHDALTSPERVHHPPVAEVKADVPRPPQNVARARRLWRYLFELTRQSMRRARQTDARIPPCGLHEPGAVETFRSRAAPAIPLAHLRIRKRNGAERPWIDRCVRHRRCPRAAWTSFARAGAPDEHHHRGKHPRAHDAIVAPVRAGGQSFGVSSLCKPKLIRA